MTVLFRDGYTSLSVAHVFSLSGSQFDGTTDSGFRYEKFFGIGGDEPVGGPFSLGGPVSVNLPFVGETELFRARVFGELGATFGINIIAALEVGNPDPAAPDEPVPGSINAVLPYRIAYAVPELDPVADDGALVNLLFASDFAPEVDPQTGFNTLFPGFLFELQLVAALDVLLAAEFGALGNNGTVKLLDFDAETVFPLVSVDTTRTTPEGDADPVNLLGVTTQELIDLIPGTEPAYNLNGEFAGIGVPFAQFLSSPKAKEQPKPETQVKGDEPPKEENEVEPPDPTGLDVGRIEIFVPNINTVSKEVDGVFVTDPSKRLVDGVAEDDLDPDGDNLNAGNKDDLAALTLDLDGILTYATGFTFPPLEYNFPAVGFTLGDFAAFSAQFSYNLFDVELRAALPLVQEFTLTPAFAQKLRFFEKLPDGSKGAPKLVDVVQIARTLEFDESGSFQSDEVARRLKELAADNERVAQDVALFVDFDAGIPGSFTGQTGSIGGRLAVSEDGGTNWRDLFSNAADPIAESAPALGRDQTAEIDVSGLTFAYRIYRDDVEGAPDEFILIDFDPTATVFRFGQRERIAPLSETPFLTDLAALALEYDGDETLVEIESRAQPLVTHRTGLEFDLSMLLQGLGATAAFGAAVDLGPVTISGGFDVELGPLFSERYPLFNADLVDLYVNDFQLFDSTFTSFVLGAAPPPQDYGDAILGTTGNDAPLEGTGGDDVIFGFAGDDSIFGFGGDDLILPGEGRNEVDGGDGIDTVDFGDIDRPAVASGPSSFNIGERPGVLHRLISPQGAEEFGYSNANLRTPSGGPGDLTTMQGVERVLYTEARDRLEIWVSGLAPLFDVPLFFDLRGDADEARITLGRAELESRGFDLRTGDGDDLAEVFTENAETADWSAIRIDGGAGIDTLVIDADFDLATGIGALGAVVTGFENLTAFADYMSFAGRRLAGDDGDNVLTGSDEGPDVLIGRRGDDTLRGLVGDDTLDGGAGADELDGGDGLDTATYADAPTSVFVDLDFGGVGRGFRGHAQGDALISIENLVGSAFDDILIGSNAANRLEGGEGDDRLMAQFGNDTLIGGPGDDLMAYGSITPPRTWLFDNLYDGGEGFDVVAVDVWAPFTQSASTTGSARYTYNTGSTFSSSDTTSDRSVTVDYRYTRSAHVEARLSEDGSGVVDYVENAVEGFEAWATNIKGTAIYSHATPRSVVDFFPPYRTATSSFDYGLNERLVDVRGNSISFSKDSDYSNTSGSGYVRTLSVPSYIRDETVFATETLIDVEGVIGSRGDDILEGNSAANALYGNGGWDIVAGGGGDDLLGFGEGQALVDIFSFPGSTGGSAPVTYFPNLEELLVQYDPYSATVHNPYGDDFTGSIATDAIPVGRIRIGLSTQTDVTQVIGSMVWGQGGNDWLDMRHDRGLTFLPDSSTNYATVDLNVASAGAGVNVFTGEQVMYGRAEWRAENGSVLSLAHTFGVHNVIGSQMGDVIRGDRADNVIEGLGGGDEMHGEEGFDTLSYVRATEGVALNFVAAAGALALDNRSGGGAGDATGDHATGFERVLGSDFDDTVALPAAVTGAYTYAPTRDIAFQSHLGPSLAPMEFDLGDGDDHMDAVGDAPLTVALGAGDDTATVGGVGKRIDAGAGDDVIEIAPGPAIAFLGTPAADRMNWIAGGAGFDTVVFSSGDVMRVDVTPAGAWVYQKAEVPATLFSDPAQPATPEATAWLASASRPIIHVLTGVEMLEIGGERMRLDAADPVLGPDLTLRFEEDARAPFRLGVSAPKAELDAGATYRVVELPAGAGVGLPGGPPLAVGDVFTAAELGLLVATAGQDYGDGIERFVYARVGATGEADRVATLPAEPPVPGVPLGLGLPVDPLGGALEIEVTEVPTAGVVFLRVPDPAWAAIGLTVMTEREIGLGDLLTPKEVAALHFRPDPDATGPAGAFAYRADTGLGFRDLPTTADADMAAAGVDPATRDGAAERRVEIELTPVDDTPDIPRLLFPLSPGGVLNGRAAASDPEGDAFELELVRGPSLGELGFAPDGSFVYRQTGALDFAGADFVEDSFTVRAVQENGLVSAARVQVLHIVNPAALAPIVFDAARPEVFFDDAGAPIRLGGLGTDDEIVGHAGPDGLFGFGGHDRIEGLAGDDELDGGEGNDTIEGGSGDDTARGGEGDDRLFGGRGDDELHGDAGDDIIVGGAGADAAVFAIAQAAATLSVEGNWIRVVGEGSDLVYRDVEVLRFSDGEVATAGLIATPEPEPVLGEAGTLSFRQTGPDEWHSVLFDQPIRDAVVVMGPPGFTGPAPSVMRVRNVTDAGFEFQLDEWDYLDGSHAPETASWLALSEGVHRLEDGRTIVAGSSAVGTAFAEIALGHDFGTAPVMLAQLASDDDPAAATPRLRRVDGDSFEAMLQEEEAADQLRAPGRLDWIAVEPGLDPAGGIAAGVVGGIGDAGGAIGYGGAFAAAPALLATMQTFAGIDPSALRWTAAGASGATVFVQEEQSADAETRHVAETVGFLALETGAVAGSFDPWRLTPDAALEAGTVRVRQSGPDQWHSVSFAAEIPDAVVAMGPAGFNGPDPATMRVRNVTDTGFEFQLDEWDYLDGSHGFETVGWLAVSAGAHVLPDGRTIAAGLTTGTHAFAEVAFGIDFGAAPVVLVQAASVAEPSAVTVRLRDVASDRFDFRLQEEEAADGAHAPETVSWIAVETGLDPAAGIAAGVVPGIGHLGGPLDFGGAFAESPALLANLQSYLGPDPAALRFRDLGTAGVNVFTQEEQSRDAEIGHLGETVGFLAIETGYMLL